jgi:hypothetical protein
VCNSRARIRSRLEIRNQIDQKTVKAYSCLPRRTLPLENGQYYFLEETFVALFKVDGQAQTLGKNADIFVYQQQVKTISYCITGNSVEEIKKIRSEKRKEIESPKNQNIYMLITV